MHNPLLTTTMTDVLEEYDSAEDDEYKPQLTADDDEDGDGSSRKRKKGQAKKPAPKRGRGGRVGGIMLEDDSDGAGPAVVEAAPTAPTAEEVAAAEKAKQDELDALFAAELGMPVKKAKPATKKPTQKKKKSGPLEFKMPGCAANRTKASSASATQKKETVQVQKTYDFAGEAVVMTKEVDANSKEAKAYEAEVAKAKAPKKALDGVLSLMKKKTAMSTVTKTQLDWDGFKEETGIADELAAENKDGYLEKVAFLQQVDARAHENELRMKDLERGKKSSR